MVIKSGVRVSDLVVSICPNSYHKNATLAGRVNRTKLTATLTRSRANLCSRILVLLVADQLVLRVLFNSSPLNVIAVGVIVSCWF